MASVPPNALKHLRYLLFLSARRHRVRHADKIPRPSSLSAVSGHTPFAKFATQAHTGRQSVTERVRRLTEKACKPIFFCVCPKDMCRQARQQDLTATKTTSKRVRKPVHRLPAPPTPTNTVRQRLCVRGLDCVLGGSEGGDSSRINSYGWYGRSVLIPPHFSTDDHIFSISQFQSCSFNRSTHQPNRSILVYS